jgi:predicted alpha/beta superfamily hydrolase
MMEIKLTRYPAMKLDGLLPRDVWVWTPSAYQNDPAARFPVIYMHDAQNLFYPEKSYTHVTWGVAEAITKLSSWGFIQPAIVVGIDNTENRIGDYMPFRPFQTPEGKAVIESLAKEIREEFGKIDPVADLYLKLIVDVIKPRVDQDFRTWPDISHTFIMGSSMGGLISLYALVEYPAIFGGAGCFSTHWPVVDKVILPYLQTYLPEAGRHKLYFDHGSEDLDAEYAPHQAAVDQVGFEKGYVLGKDWLKRFGAGTGHHERSWRSRMHIALRFFLGELSSFQ